MWQEQTAGKVRGAAGHEENFVLTEGKAQEGCEKKRDMICLIV